MQGYLKNYIYTLHCHQRRAISASIFLVDKFNKYGITFITLPAFLRPHIVKSCLVVVVFPCLETPLFPRAWNVFSASSKFCQWFLAFSSSMSSLMSSSSSEETEDSGSLRYFPYDILTKKIK